MQAVKKVIITHPNLMSAGGSEVTCLMVIDLLQELECDVTLITDNKVDFKILNEKFNTNIIPDNVCIIRPMICRILGKIEPYIHLFAKFQSTLLNKAAKKRKDKYDLLISTKQEADFGKKGIQFLQHTPDGLKNGIIDKYYLWVLSVIGRKKTGIEKNITIANSQHIKKIYDDIYQNDATVVYPAIRTAEKTNETKENYILNIGRIEPEKNTEEAIHIVDKLIERGINTKLKLIGKGRGKYYDKIKKMADEREHVHMEGFVSTEKYFELIHKAKFGLHTRIDEPYGVTVAEMIDAGCITFAHDSGGLKEILRTVPELAFNNRYDAVDKIEKMYNKDTKTIENKLKKIAFNDRKKYIIKFKKILKEEFDASCQ